MIKISRSIDFIQFTSSNDENFKDKKLQYLLILKS